MVVINWIVEKKKKRKPRGNKSFFLFQSILFWNHSKFESFLWSLNCSLAAKTPPGPFDSNVKPSARELSARVLDHTQHWLRIRLWTVFTSTPLAALHPGAPRPCEGRVTQPSPSRGSPAPVHDWGLPGLPDRIPSRTACSSTRKTHSNHTWLLFEFTLDDLDSSCKIQTAVCAGNAVFNKAQNSIRIQRSLTQTCTRRNL